MLNGVLYKYLDYDGALAMLKKKNIQFTNASQFNDPFDCHPALLNYSNCQGNNTYQPIITKVAEERLFETRNRTWLCCLSKTYNNLLMWSYYASHSGVCIGLKRDYLFRCFWQYCGIRDFTEGIDVDYKDILQKPNYFSSRVESFRYQLCTKGLDWEHEQEVRFALFDSAIGVIPCLPKVKRDTDLRIVRFYPRLQSDTFTSIYLGIRMPERQKKWIIKQARKTNPEISIYQMTIHPERFSLAPVLINPDSSSFK